VEVVRQLLRAGAGLEVADKVWPPPRHGWVDDTNSMMRQSLRVDGTARSGGEAVRIKLDA
jgi:hypothetical protein